MFCCAIVTNLCGQLSTESFNRYKCEVHGVDENNSVDSANKYKQCHEKLTLRLLKQWLQQTTNPLGIFGSLTLELWRPCNGAKASRLLSFMTLVFAARQITCIVFSGWISPMRDACLRAQPRHLQITSNKNILATFYQIQMPYCRHACSVTGMYLIAFEAQQFHQTVSLHGRIRWYRRWGSGL